MFRNRSANVHQFSMVPRADIPRSKFRMEHTHKTTFDSGWLIPVYLDEVLPGDSFNVRMTAFARMSTPIFPLMDNLYMDTFFFFVPNRLLWDNWQKFMGEQTNPGDSTSYLIPQVISPVGGFVPNELADYFGLPTAGQLDPAGTISVSALPFRAYSLIYNEWFRDENLCVGLSHQMGDGPDDFSLYGLRRRGKRHDYFTSCLPWPQKGPSVDLPLGGSAPVVGSGQQPTFYVSPNVTTPQTLYANTDSSVVVSPGAPSPAGGLEWANTGLFTDLSQATAATINQLRQAFQIQKLIERDARGGTRYTEILKAHFGVTSPDARLQRPEYLGGGSAAVNVTPIAQTSATGAYADTPQGNLSAFATVLSKNVGFTQSFTEHGYVMGIVSIRGDLTYQQGTRRHWSRRTRYDYYFPAFAMLGEQAVLNKEIFSTGIPLQDDAVFGYQERWAEYRYNPSMISGLFRSTATDTLDAWHIAQHFVGAPALNSDFIGEQPPLDRILAVGAEAGGAQFIFDSLFSISAARPLPMYSVPGLIDHF